MEDDKFFLEVALDEAMEGIKMGGGPFGAVITRKGKIVSKGYNMVIPGKDPSAHAEIVAIREAAALAGTHDLSDCTLYASCEPCPMCLGAIYWAGIKRVIYYYDRKDAEKAGFDDNHIYMELLLPPSERQISFNQLSWPGGKDVFRMWHESETKTPY